MSDDQEKTKLEYPFISTIPYALRKCKMPPSAQLYYGSIVGLAQKEGYCFATDAQLADLHAVDERTIKRWNDILEKNKFIYRQTYNVKLVDQNDVTKFRWKRKRKIWVNGAFCPPEIQSKFNQNSNNSSESDKNVKKHEKCLKSTHYGSDKNVTFLDGDKNVPYKSSTTKGSTFVLYCSDPPSGADCPASPDEKMEVVPESIQVTNHHMQKSMISKSDFHAYLIRCKRQFEECDIDQAWLILTHHKGVISDPMAYLLKTSQNLKIKRLNENRRKTRMEKQCQRSKNSTKTLNGYEFKNPNVKPKSKEELEQLSIETERIKSELYQLSGAKHNRI